MGERASCPRIAMAGLVWTVWLSGSLVSVGVNAAAPQPAPALAIEEVLRQTARITWSNGGTRGHPRVQRRTQEADGRWGDWVDVTDRGTDPGFILDAGPTESGLPPAHYAYRVRAPGVSAESAFDWSESVEFTIPPQCDGGVDAPGNEPRGSLPTVSIGDLDGDGRYTGADVWIAMERCSKLGGCLLEALPVTYEDVAISLYGQNDTRPCYLWNALICKPMPPFPNGLVIQGHGSATVFRSPVWKTPYKPSPIFEFWHAPGVQLRFRNFVLDGRKREQHDPTPGKNDINVWRHRGLDVTHYFGPDHRQRYPNGCVHNVTARDFMGSGIEVDHAQNWRIEYNHVQDIGCWRGLTECPALTIPDTNPPPDWGCTGHQAPGYGIEFGGFSEDSAISHNEITRVSKYAIGIKGGSEGTEPIRRLSLADNRIVNVGTVGIFLAGTIDSTIERNLVDGTHAPGCRDGGAWAFWGIQTNGTLNDTRVRANTLRNLAGIGIGSNAVADGAVFEDNRIEEVCSEQNAQVGSRLAAIHLGAGSAGTFTFARNSVTANHCSMALAACWGSNAQVVVDGGYYSTAENSDVDYGAVYVESGNSPLSPRLLIRGGAIFEYVGTDRTLFGLGRAPGIIASGNGRVVVQDESVIVSHYRRPFHAVRSCLDRCAAEKSGVIVQCASDASHPECARPVGADGARDSAPPH